MMSLCFAFSLSGQNTLSTTGGHIKTNGGSLSFSVGQVSNISKKGSTFYINERVQQVYSKKITAIKELGHLKDIQLYPNPTSEDVTLLFSNKENRSVKYSLIDNVGREIKNGMIVSEKAEISLKNLPSGNYLLLLKSKIEHRVFNLVKMQ
ncbi:MAG: T9SS type A sorting domain-containing protein [Saprospiraceae bacterium]|nr:T9SS type A sorting domain-containing protein [Saprospiraceae bacterium]